MLGRPKSAPGRLIPHNSDPLQHQRFIHKAFLVQPDYDVAREVLLGRVFFLKIMKGGSFLPSAVHASITVRRECLRSEKLDLLRSFLGHSAIGWHVEPHKCLVGVSNFSQHVGVSSGEV